MNRRNTTLRVTISASDIYENGIPIPCVDVEAPEATGAEDDMVIRMTGTGLATLVSDVREELRSHGLTRFCFAACDARRQRCFIWAAKRQGLRVSIMGDVFGCLHAVCEF